ncbi:MAG: hypothetical protein FAF03_04505 [Epsilonproteobacteria bacterium]|nr:hypothetical protein [Campylobacterota bacterium]
MDKKLKEIFEFDVFLNQLNNISQSELLENIQYGATDLILGYASNIEECKELVQKAKSSLRDKFNDKECIDTCNAPYNEYLFKKTDILDFTSNFEKEWDTSSIESLVVGTYLEDIGRIKKAY